jgi:hypothetical protein
MSASILEALFEGLEKAGSEGQRRQIFDQIADVLAAHVDTLFDDGAVGPVEDMQATWAEVTEAGEPHDTGEDDARRGGHQQPRQAVVP